MACAGQTGRVENGRKNPVSISISVFVGGNGIGFGKCGFRKWKQEIRVHGSEPIQTEFEWKWSEVGT
jgi:hypothetical protein